MNWPVFMHALGILCLAAMLGLSVWSLFDSLAPSWSRIVSAYRGQPVSEVASVASPTATCCTPLRAVEADAEPTLSVHQ